MGNYATSAELKARFENDNAVAHLTNTQDTGIPDEDIISQIIDDSESIVDSYIGKRYEIPVDVSSDTSLSKRLKAVALDLAEVMLMRLGTFVPESKELQYTQAIAWLKDISSGKALLPMSDNSTADPTGADEPTFSSGYSTKVSSRSNFGNL